MFLPVHGDSLNWLKSLEANCVDAVVTDPPYGLKFMGKHWDYDVPSAELWREVLRVLKPGGHLLSFGGTRTYHRMACAIEDAGFEIRDQVQWIYGSGFPKSLNLKDIWQGWGTALKPANEPICLARKPLEKGLTVAQNVEKWGCGAINIDGSRVSSESMPKACTNQNIKGNSFKSDNSQRERDTLYTPNIQGRWPANVIFDEEAAAVLDAQSGTTKSGKLSGNEPSKNTKNVLGDFAERSLTTHGDSGGASRFFYIAKASKRERNAGLEGMPERDVDDWPQDLDPGANRRANHHPTVKPIKLMEYLIKLITPPGGTVLDPFMGSGSTGVAARGLGFLFIGVELSKEYFEISEKRIAANDEPQLEMSEV